MLRIVVGILLGLSSSLVLAEGDSQRGKDLTVACGACHGADGNSPAGSFPNLAGQGEKYLYKQLKDIQSGARSAPLMTGQLDGKSDQDLMDMAAYFSGQSAKVGAAKADLVVLGETIYRAGIARKSIAACTACHSPTGKGNDPAGFPALSGQWPEYVEAQLQAFRSGVRHNDGDSKMMRMSAMDLSDEEIKAVASYVRGLN